MRVRYVVGGAAVAITTFGALAGTAFAHDCFNPNKQSGAGTWATVTLNEEGEGVGFDQTKKQGGFIAIDASALGLEGTVDIHTFGAGGPKSGVAGGPNLEGSDRACDGKGIDLASACFGEG